MPLINTEKNPSLGNSRSTAKTCRGHGALLGLKPSRFIHQDTFIVHHAVLIFSSTPLNAVQNCALCLDRQPSHAKACVENFKQQSSPRQGFAVSGY
jgi:hypothetical protein